MTATPPTLCARCAQQGKTCCQGREIYITPEDRQRIRAFAGKLEFVEWLPALHPLTYTADRIDAEPDEGCPRHLLSAAASVFDAIHMTMDLARQWHRQLYEEIITDDHDDRIDLRPSL